MVDALKRASAKRITVVLPFYGYARQDKKHRGREPISARLIADLFRTAGADRLMTVDLHTSQIQGFFDGPVDHLFATAAADPHVAQQRRGPQPDHGRVARTPAGCGSPSAGPTCSASPLAIIHKRRDPDVPNEAKVLEVVGDVEGRTCVVIDDMIDTGGTIVKAAEALFEKGAADVIVAATHGILSGDAVDRFKNCPVSEVVVTDTLPDPARPAIRQADGAADRAAASPAPSSEVFEDGSVTSMFEVSPLSL